MGDRKKGSRVDDGEEKIEQEITAKEDFPKIAPNMDADGAARTTKTKPSSSNNSNPATISSATLSPRPSLPTLPGAVRVVGIDGKVEGDDDDDDDILNPSTPDIENMGEGTSQVHSRGLPAEDIPHVVPTATKVPDFAIAVANPEEHNHPTSCYCCGVRCGSVEQEVDKTKKRRLYLILAAVVVIVAIIVGLVVVLSRDHDAGGGNGVGLDVDSNETTLETKKFFTTLNYTHCFFGHMFDITARKNLRVVGMAVHLKSNTTNAIGKQYDI